ncbi:ImmA/IrrE family metallo-endopeptidase [Chitinophaga tropicalis]|uniref:ImmA/IrrE family metallo-endopeptidase n=1 Tax=Chitinophaga tropicalis TaxID=2683588 RepID=A0A7K1U066_9BACT|nr:ImmA/IrrE family metallo-endopeptidase [Chitinophaga tropicalis]MVT07752.1 ImmA/IrrE family metallo-endopeptidase [Chitinophaga tropicalis]
MTVKSIHKAANDLLEQFGSDQLPVRIEDVARFKGINVVPFPLENDVSGILVIEPGGATIGYNQEESRVRRRFTVAHELGHFMLHNTQNDRKVFVDNTFKVSNEFKVLFRSKHGQEEPTTARMEFEANTFAAAILMPEKYVFQLINEIEFDLGDEAAVKELSRRFDVSSTAMYYRLLNLR